MANKIYPKALERSLSAGLDLGAHTIKAVFIDTATYTYSDAHEFMSSVPVGARIATSAALTGKTIATVNTDDVRFDVADYSVTFAASQPTCEALIYFAEIGTDAQNYLIKYVDTSASLPLTPPPGGGTVNVTVSANGVFELRNV